MRRYCIGLGSNKGDSERNLRGALERLRALDSGLALSKLYKTAPQDKADQADFLNLAVLLSSELEPQALLESLLEIEKNFGRNRQFEVPKGPRTLDLDILYADSLVFDSPDLRIPHKSLTERAFALRPLLDLLPDAVDPVSGRPLSEFLEGLGDQSVEQVDWAAEAEATGPTRTNPQPDGDRAVQLPPVHLSDFDGPLDVLLFLIKKNEMNIYDIPIASITAQFIEILNSPNSLQLEELTEFYYMAATLLHIKSRMLLPVEYDFDDDISDPRAGLVQQLIDYQKFKVLTERLAARQVLEDYEFPRQSAASLEIEAGDNWEKVEIWQLFHSFRKLLRGMTRERIIDLYEEVTVNEKLALILEFNETKDEYFFSQLVRSVESPQEVICALLAVLESAKLQLIQVFQNRLFDDILLRPRRTESADGKEGD